MFWGLGTLGPKGRRSSLESKEDTYYVRPLCETTVSDGLLTRSGFQPSATLFEQWGRINHVVNPKICGVGGESLCIPLYLEKRK